ncbi:MAG: hypothetical protein M3Z54_13730 [Gemmatimonadota bacterium]|nr:hypothetical protein [Gemmatimonadota bacterium]
MPDPFAGAEGAAGGGESDSEFGAAEDSGAGLELGAGEGAGDGRAGDVILSRASGICAASGVGVEGSIGSRYGSASP